MNIPQDVANTIVDPKAYADGRRVDEAFTWLRREAPLAQAQPEGFDPFWVVTRHADIQLVERQNELFHNGDRSTVVTVIDKLEDRGLVERHAADRRSNGLFLADKGATLLRELKRKVALHERRVVQDLSMRERTQLIALLQRILPERR